MLTQTDGTSGPIIPVSDTTTTSAASSSAWVTSSSSKWGLPTSSSPSTTNLRLTGNEPSRARRPRAASIW